MPLLDEHFTAPAFDPRLTWFNPPPSSELGPDGLCLETKAGSDFWQRTHYGFEVDSGHALLLPVSGNFRLETQVHFAPRHQYDQAGLLVRVSAHCWLKTSIEFEGDSPSRLGSVVTNGGWSDWATQDVPATLRHASYRISRRAGDYLVEYEARPGVFTQIRLCHLGEDDGRAKVLAGLYACSPKGAGLRATFRALKLEPA